MIKPLKAIAGFFTGVAMMTSIGAGYLYSQRDAVIAKISDKAADYASQSLGTKVEIGSINLNSSSDISINDLAIYDKNSDLIAKAKNAEVNFRLLAFPSEKLSAIDEIKIHGVEGNIFKRDDDTWNLNDIKTSDSGESDFDTEILIDDINLNVSFDKNSLAGKVDSVKLDFDTTAEFDAKVNNLKVSGNYEENKFDAEKINVALDFDHGEIKTDIDSEKISAFVEKNFVTVENLNANVNVDEYTNVKADVKAQALNSNLHVDVNANDSRQIINLDTDSLDLNEVVPLIPHGTIPDGVEILSGIVKGASISVDRRGDNIKFGGTAQIENGSVIVEQTQIDDINGSATFNNKKILLDASAQSNGQYAQADGEIRLDTDEIYFDLDVKSDSFSPNAVMYLPAEGSAAFNAHLSGTASNPIVDADIYSGQVNYENIFVDNVSTHLKYQNNAVYLTNINADTFGGNVTGDFELQAMDLTYNAHLKVNDIELSNFGEFVPALNEVSGKISGDLGINGVSDDLNNLKVYGSAMGDQINYNGVTVKEINTSFSVDGDDTKIDYLSAELASGGTLGLEGTITDGRKLDLKYYAARTDLTIAEKFLPNIEISGLADFQGSVHGDADNPNVDLKFSAVDVGQFKQAQQRLTDERRDHLKGRLLNQPYDTIKFTANGSLNAVEVNDFVLTKDGKDIWLAKGKVGLAGEKNIDLRVDTVGARVENIIKLIAPDQQLTGNINNVITITGTLDKPNITGYVHFWRGSYNGALINGMDGDYFMEGDIIRLQDFHVFSPMVDMDLNGTINSKTTDMDFLVEVHDIDVHRFEGKLPDNYPAQGHGKFSGVIKGNLNKPLFDGTLTADELNFNGVSISDVNGRVRLDGDDIYLDNFSFFQDEGTYEVHGKINYKNEMMSGKSEVHNAEIKNLLTLANQKTDLVQGALTSTIQFGGNLKNPSLKLIGEIPLGTLADCDIHNITLDLNLLNHVLYLKKLEGYQGETGTINASGSTKMNGELDIKLSASNLELAMIGNVAGFEMIGNANIDAIISGTTDNPNAQVELSANGGFKNSTVDLIRSSMELKDGIVNVENFSVQKAIKEKIYQISAKGLIPLVSLNADKKTKLQSNEQINLNISLDNADLSLLPLLSEDYIAWGLGPMAGNLKVTGTASQPLINGAITLKDGTTKIKGMKNLIEHMNLNLVFKDDTMTLEECSGKIGSGGYNINGELKINGLDIDDYNFKLVIDKPTINSSFFNGEINGEFELKQAIDRGPKHETLPKIEGHLDFDKCTISIPSIPESEDEMSKIILDVTINLGDKVHFYSPYLFDMYATGGVRFEGTTHFPIPSGIITVKKGGTVSYLKTTFDVREGELQFIQAGSFMPNIIFFADTKVGRTRVYLSCEGDLGERRIKLSSSPEMSETEIMQLLTLREAYQKGGDNEIDSGDLLMLGLQMTFLGEVEAMVKKTTGFDQFTISRGSGSAFDNKTELRERHEEEYHVTMGKYITDKVMAKYTRGIGGDNINRYGFQYDFNDNISGTIEREGSSNIFGIEARWKF